MTPAEELENFKSQIDLRAYAASLDYQRDPRDSWPGSDVLRRASDRDKIVVTRDTDGHWIYASVRDPADNGSIIDFAQHRQRLNLGQVRRTLRPWLGRPAPDPAIYAHLQRTPKNRAAVIARLADTRTADRHPYLERHRGIPPSLLSSPRFQARIRIDARGNAIFPHQDRDGICGAEIKNLGYTGAPKGGSKGLWVSACRTGDTTLVLAETGIDALSYAALHPDSDSRYAATSGALNPAQPRLILAAVRRLTAPARLVIATDRDSDGDRMADQVTTLVARDGPEGLVIARDAPPAPAKDWNDVLRARSRLRDREAR